MSYEVFIERGVQKALIRLPEGLPDVAYERVSDAIDALAEDPRPPGSIELSGRPGYRLRIDDYHILYAVDDEERVVAVFRVGHRRDIYH